MNHAVSNLWQIDPETQAAIHPPACVFGLRFILCRREIELGGQMCQLLASEGRRHKSYGGEEVS